MPLPWVEENWAGSWIKDPALQEVPLDVSGLAARRVLDPDAPASSPRTV